LNSVRSYAGLSITTASFSDGPAVPAGRCFIPDRVRSAGTSSRDRVRSAMVPKTRSIRAPEAKIRFRLYSAWKTE